MLVVVVFVFIVCQLPDMALRIVAVRADISLTRSSTHHSMRRRVSPCNWLLRRVRCWGPGRQEISIDCCTVSSSRAATAACCGRMRAVPRCQRT